MAMIEVEIDVTLSSYMIEKIETLRTLIMLQGCIETLQSIKSNWEDERMIKFDEMIVKMKDTLFFLKAFDEQVRLWQR